MHWVLQIEQGFHSTQQSMLIKQLEVNPGEFGPLANSHNVFVKND